MRPVFTWPTDQRYVSSGFTDRRSYGQHNAIDIPAPTGSPVRAPAYGRVAFAGVAGSAGLAVFIDHDDGWRSHYCHLNFMRVTAGEVVNRDNLIGDVGSTGVSTGPHLHLNLFAPTEPAAGPSAYVDWVGKWAVDPLDYLTEEADMPMSPEELARLAAVEEKTAELEQRAHDPPQFVRSVSSSTVYIVAGGLLISVKTMAHLRKLQELGYAGEVVRLPHDDPIWKLPTVKL